MNNTVFVPSRDWPEPEDNTGDDIEVTLKDGTVVWWEQVTDRDAVDRILAYAELHLGPPDGMRA